MTAKSHLPLTALLVALMLFVSTSSTGNSTTTQASRLRVVVISVDAVRFDHVTALASQGVIPNLGRMIQSGVYAELETVYPSATAVAHAAISTGAPPGVNGIVGNAIHLPGTLVTSTVSGFSGFQLLSEPIWMAVDRQGLRAIVVSFPQSTPPAWNVSRSILFNIYDASAAFTPSALYTTNTSVRAGTYINFTVAANWTGVSEVFGNVSSALESTIRIGDTVWYLYLADIEGDGRYDRLAIAPEKDLRNAYAILREGEWSSPINTTIVHAGRVFTIAPRFKALRFNPVSDFRLYRGLTRPFEAAWFNNEEVARAVWNNVIVKTGTFTDGDFTGLVNEWFDEETYIETVYFTNLLFKEFTLFVMRNYDWDLIMSYTPVIDNVYHQFLGLTYPSMPYYIPDRASYYWDLIVRTYKFVDEFIGEVLSSAPENTVVIVLSDHGQTPVRKIVYVNGILHNNGYIAVDPAFRVIVNQTKAFMVWHGHIFVNLAGRELNGTVTPEEYEELVLNLTRLLRSYKDPETGEYIFDIVLTRNESAFIGLGGVRTGDIVVAVKPGYTTSTALVRDPATGRAVELGPAVPLRTVTGDHGPILPHYHELVGVFIACGPGISGGYLGRTSVLNVAPTIAMLLNVSPPRDSKMPPIFRVFELTKTLTETTTMTKTSTVTTTATMTVITTEVRTQPVTVYFTTTAERTITTTVPVATTLFESQTVTETTTRVVTREVTHEFIRTETVSTLDATTTGVISITTLAIGLVIGLLLRRR